MKRTVWFILLAALLITLPVITACQTSEPAGGKPAPPAAKPAPASAPAPAAKEIRLVSQIPQVPPGSLNTKRLVDIANETAKGEYTVKWIGGPETIAPPDAPGSVQKGVVEMAESLHSALAQMVPGLATITFGELSYPEMEANGACTYIRGLLNKVGIQYLATIQYTPPQRFIYLVSTKPVKSLDDFKRLKIGNPSPLFAPAWKALGAEPIIIPRSEFYEAMQRGVIDAVADPISSIDTAKYYEVAKNIIDVPFASQASCYFMNLNFWNSLSQTGKDRLLESFKKYDSGELEWYKKNIDEPALERIKKGGMQFLPLPAADEKKFRDTFRDACWAAEIQKAPEVAGKLKELLIKK